jgi:multiple sugar transport system substrate-binding protein
MPDPVQSPLATPQKPVLGGVPPLMPKPLSSAPTPPASASSVMPKQTPPPTTLSQTPTPSPAVVPKSMPFVLGQPPTMPKMVVSTPPASSTTNSAPSGTVQVKPLPPLQSLAPSMKPPTPPAITPPTPMVKPTPPSLSASTSTSVMPSKSAVSPLSASPTPVPSKPLSPLPPTPSMPTPSAPQISVTPMAKPTPSVMPASAPKPIVSSMQAPGTPQPLVSKPPAVASASPLPPTPAMPSPVAVKPTQSPIIPVAPMSAGKSPVVPMGSATPTSTMVKPPAPFTPPTSASRTPLTAPPAAGGGNPPQEKPGLTTAKASDIKKSPFRFLPLILGVFALLGAVWFIATRVLGLGGSTPQQPTTTTTTPSPKAQAKTTVTYWGLWEATPVMEEVLKDFQTKNPTIQVSYVQQSPQEYRERLQDAIRRGQGPDLFRFHASWVPMLRSNLAAAPASVITPADFDKTYYPVASQQLKSTAGIVGIPLMYDGLALYYNTEMLETAGISPPTTWSEVETAAKKLVVRPGAGTLERAGIALGSATNVDNFSDILGLLILQNGGDPSLPNSKLVADSVRYYTNFVKTLRVWDETLPNSTHAFATEKAAMMIGPSWRAFEVKSLNPSLQFAIAPVPQLPGTKIGWASYWAEGVSKSSKNQDAAWKLLSYLSSSEVLQKLHGTAATKTPRLFGEIYPRTDMAGLLASDPYAGAYLNDAPTATTWWMNSRTFDNGINDRIIKYYEDVINAVLKGTSTPEDALPTAAQGVQQILQQYSGQQ